MSLSRYIEIRTLIAVISIRSIQINSIRFNLDQLNVGREAFMNMLTQSLEQPSDAEIVDEEEAA